ncbi:RHS repeat domain-containing protein [Chitinimonas koreensis]|uniref:RHS repeat domain-containing protein n=1 Tax=Chitinimonas koreensis TaxID=356302 RepID=UPI00223F5C8D|nr:RHS repeat-associated core domain-containing protein [Chitinimonas koreensis]
MFRTLVGPNNLSTVWTYDGFGQVIDELRADGTRTVSRVLRCDASCPANAAYYSASANSGSRVVSSVYFDVLNREIMRATTGFDGRRVLVKTRYNSKGQVEAKSKPHYEGEAEPGFDLVQIEYDGVARPKLTRRYATNKAGSRVLVTEYVVYDGLKTTSQNSEAQTRVETKNAAGQLKSVTDIGGRITTYDYDAMGALVRVTQPDGNKVVTGYDLLGRKTSNADPDAGTWTYVYNVLGQLTSQTDANQKTTTFKYDLLGRLTERSEVDLVSTWVFDKPADMHCATKGWIGALCYAKASNGMRRDVKYEAKGRVESVTTTIDRAYAIGTSYDNYGRVASISYPNAVVLNNVYDERGWLVEIRNGSKSVWKAEGSAAYDAAGRLRHERYGNGIVTDTGYDADTGFAVSIAAGNGVQYGISNQVYRIDTIGRLVKRDDFVTGLNESHEYDKFNRLWKTVSNFDATREITYDDNGNIRTKTGVGTYAYPAAGQPRPHGVTGIAGTVNGVVNPTFSYDANGNMLAGAGRSASWFSFNQPKTLASGTRSYTFLYDFDHQRVQETDSLGGRVTYTINPRLDLGHGYQRVVETAGTTEKVYVSVGGRNVALIETGLKSGTKWMHHDHLGSVIAVTDEAGAVVARYRYDPWGNQVRSAGSVDPTRRGYTGHEEIDGLGLVNMNGRVYDPVVARFLSVDPVLQDASNWQNYNRYSYVLNNPLMLTDPSGYSFMEKLGGVISGSYLNREILSHVSYETGSLLVTVGSMYCGPAYMACEAAGTYDNMRAHGYSARDSIQGGVQAGVMAVINNGIGQGTKGASVFGSDAYFANVTLHAIVGGMQAEMSGGDFKAGFLSAGISAAAAPAIDQIGSDNDGENWSNPMYKAERVATAAVIGAPYRLLLAGNLGMVR